MLKRWSIGSVVMALVILMVVATVVSGVEYFVNGRRHLAEVPGPVDQAEQDRAAPAPADEFDRLVVARTDDHSRAGTVSRGRRGRIDACFSGAGFHSLSLAKASHGLARRGKPPIPRPEPIEAVRTFA